MTDKPHAKMMVGVAGWSYPDWTDFVYDRSVRDKLAFLADYVDMVEVNSTFYRVPEARQVESWLRRTGKHADFFFTAKLSREVTHENSQDPSLIRRFMAGLRPLLEAEKLRAILAQFKYDFSDHTGAREHLKWVAEQLMPKVAVVVELRHRSWQTCEALDFLDKLGVSVAHLDYPRSRQSFDIDVVPVGALGYFRLHGRNAEAWFDPKAGRDETYNYYYSRQERVDLVNRAQRIAREHRSLTIVANNHYQGKEVANALQIKAALCGHPIAVPPKLMERYQELREIAEAASLERWRATRSGAAQRELW